MSCTAVSLALYSCYLHHSMTNLLLKSLSSGLMTSKRGGATKKPSSSSRNSYSRSHASRSHASRSQQSRNSRRPQRVIEESSSDEYSQSTADYTADSSTYA